MDSTRKRPGWVSTALPQNVKLLPQLTTTSNPFRNELGRALNKIHDTKTVKYSIQHYCTAVANRRYSTDKN